MTIHPQRLIGRATVPVAGRRLGSVRGTAGTTTILGTGIPGTGAILSIIHPGMAGAIVPGIILPGTIPAITAITALGMAVYGILDAAVRTAVQG